MSSGATSTYFFPYPLQTDPVDVASDVQDLAEAIDAQFVLTAPLLSPQFTGVPLSVTPNSSDDSTKIATTAFVKAQGYLTVASASTTFAPIASPTFTGAPLAPTPTGGDSSTKIATTAFVGGAVSTHSGLTTGVHGITGSVVGTSDTQVLTNKTMDGSLNTFSNIPHTSISGLSTQYAPLNITFSPQAASYTLSLSDASVQVEMNSASANTLTIPTNAAVAFPVGTTILVAQTGAGQTTIQGDGGVTVNGTPGLKLRTQWSVATLVKRAANSWLVAGDVIA